AKFTKDGKGFYTTTDRESEFQRLAYLDLASLQPKYLSSDIKWDVDDFDISPDGRSIAFVTNEDGAGGCIRNQVAQERTRRCIQPQLGEVSARQLFLRRANRQARPLDDKRNRRI